MTCVQTTTTYSHLLGSCVTMLLSACAYIITHTVSSGEMKRERGVPARETQQQREEENSVIVEKTRKEELEKEEEEGSLAASEPQPNRTECPAGAAAVVEREVEVEHEQQEKEENVTPAESTISNGAAVSVRNGDVTKPSVSDSKPLTDHEPKVYHIMYDIII